jgi:peptidoglycan hydrolase-like protein with peptidoglycan-binding domain
MPSYFGNSQTTLIDAFFHEQDQKLRLAFRERMEKMDRRAQLTQVSGIQDEAVLDRLIELKIEPETIAAIAVVPLVAVAWADGNVQEEEREAIIAAAQAAGIQPQDGRYPMLEYWMNKRPGPQLIEAWEHYIKDICKRLDKQEIEELKRDVLSLARSVAQAAGGFLGIGNRISTAEYTVLNKLEKAFA